MTDTSRLRTGTNRQLEAFSPNDTTPATPHSSHTEDAPRSMNSATRAVLRLSEEWPTALDEMGSLEPVEMLYARGSQPSGLDKAVAVVGSRNPSAAGMLATKQIARALAQAGFVVVSGLAIGIDAAAHRAALEAGGSTIAVVGAGLDQNYPARNARLRREIEQRGTVLSEYPDGTVAYPANFPARNRIIAALSLGVVVVEGTANSGALITARHALDANRSVFAVPGSIRNPLAAGPNELIRTSVATMITDVQHIFDELAPGFVWSGEIGTTNGTGPAKLTEEEIRVLLAFDDVPLPSPAVAARCVFLEGRVQMILARLEVRGLVSRRRRGWELTETGARRRAVAAIAAEHEVTVESSG